MSVQDLPSPDDYEWDFETNESIGIWYLKGWDGFADEDLESVTEHYRERASRPDIKGTIAIFGDKTTLNSETQEYMGEEWSKNAEYVGVNRVAFVSDGITAMAVKSKINLDDIVVEDFDTKEAAMKWIRENS